MTDKMRMETADMTEKNIDKIGKLFPNCITESKDENGNIKKAINFDILKQMLSKEVVDGDEAYEFTWVGKRAAMLEANKPIRKTLRPCPEESVNWNSTENLYIEGDNLEVLKLLQESYLGKVKMIYIDPPYNTGNDFIYRDDFAQSVDEYEVESGQVDEEGNRLFKNSETNGRFHSDWCSMIYSRLMVARNLLSEDGVIFISIGDEELFNLKQIADEVFGERNYIANLIWQSTPGSNTGENVKIVTENILLICKEKNNCKFLNQEIIDNDKYSNKDEHYEKRGGFILNKLDRRMTGIHYSEALNYGIEMPDGTLLYPGNSSEKQEHWNWRWSSAKVKWGIENDFIVIKQVKNNWSIYFKQYEKVNNEDKPIKRTLSYQNLLSIDSANSARGTKEVMELFDGKYFDYPKPLSLIKYIQSMVLDKDSIILDFFSGSATTAHAVMQLNAEDGGNRKFIMVQLQEPCGEKSEAYKAGFKNICEIGKERIRRAGKKILEEATKNTPFSKGGCPQSGQGDFNSLNVDEKISPSALQAATPLYERGYLEPIASNSLIQQTLDYSGSVTPQSAKADSSPQVEPLGKATNDDVLHNDKNSTNNVSQANSLYPAPCALSPNSLDCHADKSARNDGYGSNNASLDVGFRVFKLDDSNMKEVYYSADEYSQKSLSDLESNIKEDRTDLDLLFGCLLEWGLPLSMPYSSEKINGFNVHTYNDGDLIACFDANILESVIKTIAKRKPLRAVFRDSSFADSPSKINVTEIFKLISPNTKVKVI